MVQIKLSIAFVLSAAAIAPVVARPIRGGHVAAEIGHHLGEHLRHHHHIDFPTPQDTSSDSNTGNTRREYVDLEMREGQFPHPHPHRHHRHHIEFPTAQDTPSDSNNGNPERREYADEFEARGLLGGNDGVLTTLTNEEKTLMHTDAELANKNKALVTEDGRLQHTTDRLKNKERHLESTDSHLKDKENRLRSKDQRLEGEDKRLGNRKHSLERQDDALSDKKRRLGHEDQKLTSEHSSLLRKNKDLTQKDNKLAVKGKDLSRKDGALKVEGEALTHHNHVLKKEGEGLSRKDSDLAKKGAALKLQDARLAKKGDVLKGGAHKDSLPIKKANVPAHGPVATAKLSAREFDDMYERETGDEESGAKALPEHVHHHGSKQPGVAHHDHKFGPHPGHGIIRPRIGVTVNGPFGFGGPGPVRLGGPGPVRYHEPIQSENVAREIGDEESGAKASPEHDHDHEHGHGHVHHGVDHHVPLKFGPHMGHGPVKPRIGVVVNNRARFGGLGPAVHVNRHEPVQSENVAREYDDMFERDFDDELYLD